MSIHSETYALGLDDLFLTSWTPVPVGVDIAKLSPGACDVKVVY
jgi:hypothetical protein